MWFPLILTLALATVESRVTFDKSEVLDDVDLRGLVLTASFRCSSGCRVYSPTKNDNIMITDSNGKDYKSLGDLAKMNGQVYELTGGTYKLNNKGMGNPSFVFYAVEKSAANYNTKVVYVGGGSAILEAKGDTIFTVLSSTGSVRFSDFKGDYEVFPSVYATGADAIGSCRAVFTGRSTTTILKSEFPVWGPIATINFKSTVGGRSVKVSGDNDATATGENTSSVYVTPGYVGCTSVGDSLYTNLPRVANIDSFIYVVNSNGLNLNMNGEYNIAKEADALTLTINGDTKKIYGKSTLTRNLFADSFNVKLSWTRKDGSTDRFAIQLDLIVQNNGPVNPGTSTQKPGPGPVVTSKPGEPTTSGMQSLTMLISSIVVLFALYF